MEDYILVKKKSKSFSEFLTCTQARINMFSSIILISRLYKQYGVMILCNYKNNKEILWN